MTDIDNVGRCMSIAKGHRRVLLSMAGRYEEKKKERKKKPAVVVA